MVKKVIKTIPNQPISQSANQPISQSANQPISQSANVSSKSPWSPSSIELSANQALKKLKIKKRLVGDRSYWWPFIHDWPNLKQDCIQKFIEGDYRFDPMDFYFLKDENVQAWSYRDTLFGRALYEILRPTFKHFISDRCLHLEGPSGVSKALDLVNKALDTGEYRYFMRIDIGNFYGTINHKILMSQINERFDDPRVLNYLEQVATIPVIKNAEVTLPSSGVPRRSSLSVLFGAIYLTPLDQVFENSENIFFVRFCDDYLVLAKNKSSFLKAKRKMQNILDQLKLKVSRTKTKMGALTEGFHFLGDSFNIHQTIEEKNDVEGNDTTPQTVVSKIHVNTLHERSCVRVHERLEWMREDAATAEKIQHSLLLWAAWWSRSIPTVLRSTILARFCLRAYQREDIGLFWLGLALLLRQLHAHQSRFQCATIA